MRLFIRVVVACLVGVLLMSCAGKRARQAEQREQMMQQMRSQPVGSSCTAQAAGSCPVCTIQCPVGQAALCRPGEAVGNTCAAQPSCKCGPPS